MTTTTYGYMWDSADGRQPASSKLNLYYVNGRYQHSPVTYGPGRVWCDVFGSAARGASILQIDGFSEPAILQMIARVPEWLDERAAIGWQTIYCNRSHLARVQAAARAVPHVPYYVIVSTLDGTVLSELPTPGGILAGTQAWGAGQTGIDADRTAITNPHWWRQHAAA